MGERIDDTGFGGIKVIQHEGLGYGVDSVLLAAFAAGETGARSIADGDKIVDLGSGSGVIGFILSHKIKDCKILGIECRENAVDRARRAVELNNLEERVKFVRADVKNYYSDIKYDAVVSNPPYFRQNAAIPSEKDDKYIARHETTATVADFVRTSAKLLDVGGNFYMVHRPDRLVDIIAEMRTSGIEPKHLQMVVPKAGEAANIVLIHGVKGAGKELKLLPEIAVHMEDGNYTEVINKLYERGE